MVENENPHHHELFPVALTSGEYPDSSASLSLSVSAIGSLPASGSLFPWRPVEKNRRNASWCSREVKHIVTRPAYGNMYWKVSHKLHFFTAIVLGANQSPVIPCSPCPHLRCMYT